MAGNAPFHKSILVDAVIAAAECLTKVSPEFCKVWDGTTGLGGHLEALAAAYPQARLFASDADAEILSLARARLGEKVKDYRHGNFSDTPFEDQNPLGFIFLDLGISSAHFDYFERGFSFRFDQKLDMRMDVTRGISAAKVLAVSEEQELARIFFEYGEEKLSRRIAREIVARRKINPIETTSQLSEICEKIYPPKYKAKGHAQRHPATRVFQALRIYVNGELTALEAALAALPQQLCLGGRLAIITFHSLEDRLVKRAFRNLSQIEQNDPLARSNFLPGDFQQIEPGGIAPTDAEIAENPRARSARLRILERVR
ncbi:MAG: 16S rRNA (cytosine(1402)-N(4))-methyltransferase RsmH [Spirochaetes bacterium]|nr:16S rRNA (cytosine(1402)-N(4))-methyltransferase RsmH [Spirochaetota bacterium]